jgi:cephalosporin-C deacetylase-like acetyl esterase
MLLQKYGWLVPAPVVAQIPGELDSLANAPNVKVPAIFVLAGKDRTVAPQYQKMVVDAYAGEKHLVRMPQGDHNSPIAGETLQRFQSELDWLWALVTESAVAK